MTKDDEQRLITFKWLINTLDQIKSLLLYGTARNLVGFIYNMKRTALV